MEISNYRNFYLGPYFWDNNNRVEGVLFDSGANYCVTNQFKDFASDFKHADKDQIVDGIGKGLRIEGSGTVGFTLVADNGMYCTPRVLCYCVPFANTRVASVQVLLKAYPNKKVSMDQESLTLSSHKNNPSVTVPYCPNSNLPLTKTSACPKVRNLETGKDKSKKEPKTPLPTKKHPSLTVLSNINLLEPEKDTLA